jgi:DNA-binding transcriptional LysR family regulator
MDARDLELRHIRYFVATSEALSFTRAARQLNVSQPALSHSISQLEERLGNKLFVENLVVIANAKLAIKKSRSMTLEEVAGFPLVLLRTGFCTRELIEEGLGRNGVQPDILAEFDSIDAIVSCVQEVPALSVLPEHAGHWRAYPGVKVIPLSGDRWKRSVGLVTPRVAAPLPAVSCFVDFLKAGQLGCKISRQETES